MVNAGSNVGEVARRAPTGTPFPAAPASRRADKPAARILAGANVTPAGARQATARARRVKKARFRAGRGGDVIRPRDKKSKTGENPGDT